MPEEPPPEAAFDNDDTEYRYSSRLSHRSQQPLVDICQLRTRLRTRLSAQEEALLEALGLHLGGIPRIFPNLRDLSSLRLFIFKRTGTWWSSKDIGAKIRQWEEALRGFHERDFASSDWRSDKPVQGAQSAITPHAVPTHVTRPLVPMSEPILHASSVMLVRATMQVAPVLVLQVVEGSLCIHEPKAGRRKVLGNNHLPLTSFRMRTGSKSRT
ncbi:hypothetical protein NMY22_g3255 [Coprinellus aureogranulatus]|nr:hypothetical protein NMY22_g3255 [Coprinellus aureogranulatus]